MISSPRAMRSARREASLPPFLMYHWRLVTISSGLSPFSKNLTGCVMGSGSPSISPVSRSISTTSTCAEKMVLPARRPYAARPASDSMPGGGSGLIRPARLTMARTFRFSSRHQITSVVSPNVQIMALPVPLSGSASSWATTGTSTPNTGVVTVVPNSGW